MRATLTAFVAAVGPHGMACALDRPGDPMVATAPMAATPPIAAMVVAATVIVSAVAIAAPAVCWPLPLHVWLPRDVTTDLSQPYGHAVCCVCVCLRLVLPSSYSNAICAVSDSHSPSAESRQMFECYKWTSDELFGELRTAIQTSVSRKDLHLIATDENSTVVGYIFLWAASDEIPELGIAVADRWHGRGLGPELLRCIEQMGKMMNKQALELTTMLPNKRALAVYKRAGWDHLGVIHNPLGCDVPAAFEGKATPSGIAAENHCTLIIDEERRNETLDHLAKKRERAKLIFPVPEGGFNDIGVYRLP